MITREDLKRLRYIDAAIIASEERIADIRRKAEGLSRSLASGPHGVGHHDKMAEFMVKLEREEERLARNVTEMLELEHRVRDEIEQLPEQQALVMHYRYLDVNWKHGRRLSWREVSRKTHYDERYCRKIHEVALKRLCGEIK